jgi:glutamyl-Q tRNA(Asp) synthetase
MATSPSAPHPADGSGYRGRFAPSPTGALHLGSLVAALGSWLRARAVGGVWLVRIEDLDPLREVPGAAEDILATLAAFGLESDEPVLYQSQREAVYQQAFDRLRVADRVFPCWCSRRDLQGQGGMHRVDCITPPDPRRPPAWRVRVPNEVIEFEDGVFGRRSQALRREVGDFVVRRAEGGFAYQLAVVVDDAEQRISEVVRGADLLDSTPRQLYLQRILGLPTPRYLHLPLVLDADGRKLSKQDRARPVDRHEPLPALRAALAFLGVHLPPRLQRIDALLTQAVRQFDVARLSPTPPPFGTWQEPCTIGSEWLDGNGRAS